jgi:ornithine cyclodeaminase/alanine dehydrogenase-like protein (mu-crystallin family)
MLYLGEADVGELLASTDAIDTVEASFERRARGVVESGLVQHLPLPDGRFALSGCVDRELGYAGMRSEVDASGGAGSVLLLYSLSSERFEAILAGSRLGGLCAGAVSAVAARYLAPERAQSLGVIGCGWLAASHVACLRAAIPTLERVVVHCRDARRLGRFCAELDCRAADSGQEAARQDVVVTATRSPDPVLRGEWLDRGSLVCAAGATDLARRELDNAVLARASFVCCDSRVQSEASAGDLVEPIAQGVLDWLEVYELQEVIVGTVHGRTLPEDVVVFKSTGTAASELALGVRVFERARGGGVGLQL